MALNLCKYGGEPKPGAPPSVNVTTGFLCGLFGATHPLCRLFDLGIPTGGTAKTLLQALYRALKALRTLIAAEEALEIGEEGEIDTVQFCKVYPSDVEIEDITYLDVVAALTIIGGDELMRKLSKIVYVTLWSDTCQCKGKEDQSDDDDGLDPLPVPPEPDPGSLCYFADLQTRQWIIAANNSKSFIRRIIEQNPDVPFQIINPPPLDDPALVNGFPNAFWRPFLFQMEPDENGCYCFQVIYKTVIYQWQDDVRVDGFPVSENNQGHAISERRLIWCQPPIPPEVPDPVPVADDDWLENFCDLFPETEVCVNCGATEYREVDVIYKNSCNDVSAETWALDVRQGEE